jgi:tetratricopeptide (TPR) repeat protein/transcriptional regulator with XRE-family HTH domain
MTVTDYEIFPFGTLLKDFRTRRHLTQQQLADAVGVHRHAISRWEHGDMLPQNKALVLELARRLRLDDQETRHILEASLTALAPHWLVPWPRNPLFTGREQILSTLYIQLGTDRSVALTQLLALHGLGGVGKTQIALEYAYRHTLEYSAVFWVEAETEEQIIASLRRIAEVLQVVEGDGRDQQHVLAAVQRWLSTHSQWLLIWDNVEDLYALDRFLPPARQGAILITTRCQALGTFARGLDVYPMKREEGMLFLFRRAKVLEPDAGCEQLRRLATCKPGIYTAAAELVSVLGGLPLALDQAGAYLEETRCGLPSYLDLFRTRRAVLLQQRGEGASQHLLSVWASLRLSITATAGRHPAIGDLLSVCALLQPEAIPEELFRQGTGFLGSQLETVGCDPLEWDRVIAIACEYSLCSRQAEARTLSMHRLVQAVLQDTMTDMQREHWTRCVLFSLNALFPEAACDVWQRCARLLPHVLRCAALLSDQGVGQDSLADLLRKAADYLRECAQYGLAEPLYRRALLVREQEPEAEPPALIAVLGGLALLSAEQGKHQQAEHYYHRALQLQGQVTGKSGEAHLLCGLASLLCRQGRYEQAESYYQQVLQTQEHLAGSDHPLIAHALAGLATLFASQGKYEQAEPLYRQALQIQERVLDPAHPDLATSVHGLAMLSQEQGEYSQAEALFQQALQIWEQALSKTHPRVAAPLCQLALLYAEQGRDEQAELFYQRALQIREQAFGFQHPEVAAALNGLAKLYIHQGKLEQAEVLGKRALQIWERMSAVQHPEAGYLFETLGTIYTRQGRYSQAEALYQQALQLWERIWSQEHPAVAQTLCGLAKLALTRGKYGQAESLYRRALQIRESVLGLHHPGTAQTLHELALLYQQQGAFQQARICAERALLVRVQVLGEAHPRTGITRALCTQLQHISIAATAQTAAIRETEAGADGCAIDQETPEAPEGVSCAPDPLQEFLDACCELYPLARCRIGELWQTYEQWAVSVQKRVPLARRVFAAQLKARGCRVDRTNTARIWRGIRLVSKTP